MINARIEEEWPIKPLDSLKDLEDFDIAKYLNENVYLLVGEVINAELELKDESSIQFVIDWFGSNAKIYKKDDKILVSLRCNESALFYWCMQYSECVKVLSPESLRERIKQEALAILEKYK